MKCERLEGKISGHAECNDQVAATDSVIRWTFSILAAAMGFGLIIMIHRWEYYNLAISLAGLLVFSIITPLFWPASEESQTFHESNTQQNGQRQEPDTGISSQQNETTTVNVGPSLSGSSTARISSTSRKYATVNVGRMPYEHTAVNITSLPPREVVVVNVNSPCRGHHYYDGMYETMWLRHMMYTQPSYQIREYHYVTHDIPSTSISLLTKGAEAESKSKSKGGEAILVVLVIVMTLIAFALATIFCGGDIMILDVIVRILLITNGIGYAVAYWHDIIEGSNPGFVIGWIFATTMSVFLAGNSKKGKHVTLSLAISSIVVVILNFLVFCS